MMHVDVLRTLAVEFGMSSLRRNRTGRVYASLAVQQRKLVKETVSMSDTDQEGGVVGAGGADDGHTKKESPRWHQNRKFCFEFI
jgi:hypothetical protein